MSKKLKITKTEMFDALKRSGYLLESEISRYLSKAGFFIESNQVIEDPITGKSREIDLIAEYFEPTEEGVNFRIGSSIKFIFEIKNNLFPIVLLTRFEYSPNIEDWEGLKEVLSVPENIEYDQHEVFYEKIIQDKKDFIFTQYCSFHKKKEKDELMALHPDNIHEGLLKVTYYCEEKLQIFENSKKSDYFRHFMFMPILLINEGLYELRDDDTLHKVESSMLVYNYHFNKEPKMAYVFVVTKKGFPEFIKKMLTLQFETERKMIETRKTVVG